MFYAFISVLQFVHRLHTDAVMVDAAEWGNLDICHTAKEYLRKDRCENMLHGEKTFILYDTNNMDDQLSLTDSQTYRFYTGDQYAFCKGCFDCWLKTPGTCIFRDRVFGLANHLSDCSTFIIVSKLLYGGFSTSVKGVVDRLIAFNLPYFKKINGELHHTPRYDNRFQMLVFFYGEASEEEKETAKEYVSRIALNLNNEDHRTFFLNHESEWRCKSET